MSKWCGLRIMMMALYLLIIASIMQAQQVNISGKITDTLNNPIVGAVVSLTKIPNLSTVTNTDGSFLLQQNITVIVQDDAIDLESAFSLTNNGLILNQRIAGAMSVSIYSMKGVMLSSLFNGRLDAGSHFFAIPEQLASAPFIIGITRNNIAHYIKSSSIHTNKNVSTHGSQSHAAQNNSSRSFIALDTVVIKKSGFDVKKISIDSYETVVSVQLAVTPVSLMIPSYLPNYWNIDTAIRNRNNCYNYANNKKTNTFAQPGRGGGKKYTKIGCPEITAAALIDGLENCTGLTQSLPPGKARVAMAIATTKDYHWYREDINRLWSHKPGKGRATNLDNSSKPIADPEKANRGLYKTFCGYFFVDSDSAQGLGHENIRFDSGINRSAIEQPQEASSTMKITIMIYSGQEDPWYYLKDEKIFHTIQSLLGKAGEIDNNFGETVEPSRLGYRGIRLQNPSMKNSLPDEYIIYNNYIEHNYYDGSRQRKVFMVDSSRSIERLLLDEALLKKAIDRELRELIMEDSQL